MTPALEIGHGVPLTYKNDSLAAIRELVIDATTPGVDAAMR